MDNIKPQIEVTITETLQRKVTVPADNIEEAKELVRKGYKESLYVLDSSDFIGYEITASVYRN